MRKNRDKESIITAILETCLKASNKSAITYKNNLNFSTSTFYLDFLAQKGFLNVVDESLRRYKTTDKGEELLSRLKEIHEFL
jgi:predicted transcriptional regulator